ncbi:MAG TPA: hypothetical protein VMT64_13990 [Candidatus Binataceae bacterium]|nr:hypothetical protein [Candidatus Binataceae bacterium]
MTALSKARELSKISLADRPELRETAAGIMKAVKATRQKIDALNEGAKRNGKLDKATMDRALNRILRAAEEINREVDELLAKARK